MRFRRVFVASTAVVASTTRTTIKTASSRTSTYSTLILASSSSSSSSVASAAFSYSHRSFCSLLSTSRQPHYYRCHHGYDSFRITKTNFGEGLQLTTPINWDHRVVALKSSFSCLRFSSLLSNNDVRRRRRRLVDQNHGRVTRRFSSTDGLSYSPPKQVSQPASRRSSSSSGTQQEEDHQPKKEEALADSQFGGNNNKKQDDDDKHAIQHEQFAEEEVDDGYHHFATDYHAPVMWKECVDALLNCPRFLQRQRQSEGGDNRHPEKQDSWKMMKKKKKNKFIIDGNDELMDHDNHNNDGDENDDDRGLIFIDGTLGGGGHTTALLRRLSGGDVVIGCDVDPVALEAASERLVNYMQKKKKREKVPQQAMTATTIPTIQQDDDSQRNDDDHRDDTGEAVEEAQENDEYDLPTFVTIQANFANLHKLSPKQLNKIQDAVSDGGGNAVDDGNNLHGRVDGILLDLGVSSYQIDTAERGFAYMKDGPLDMRMGQSSSSSPSSSSSSSAGIDRGGLTAADICNEYDQQELQRIFQKYGDENSKRARIIAESIAKQRPLRTTTDLIDAVSAVTPQYAKHGRRMGRTATLARIFQSLRIVVNREDYALQRALLRSCPKLLRPGGRLVVLSYHSMEDRATKRAMRDGTTSTSTTASSSSSSSSARDMYGNYVGPPKLYRPIGKSIKATDDEVERNPRARSATLRVAERRR